MNKPYSTHFSLSLEFFAFLFRPPNNAQTYVVFICVPAVFFKVFLILQVIDNFLSKVKFSIFSLIILILNNYSRYFKESYMEKDSKFFKQL